ncbi:hypothetical protein CYMTET_18686 [Cymbomonas tetramitiformis]|uniref:Uncharacterized protein n=1 Tax=Cymbomonas tetramitiformis TaxID=36881 RepID=A0AAE0G7T1_9CHLO|nr:hypothetical protein CYMTET_18686 [Cymbomonas tetramitiformis]
MPASEAGGESFVEEIEAPPDVEIVRRALRFVVGRVWRSPSSTTDRPVVLRVRVHEHHRHRKRLGHERVRADGRTRQFLTESTDAV